MEPLNKFPGVVEVITPILTFSHIWGRDLIGGSFNSFRSI